ncbi:hypothetical protein AMQ83_26215 [Paenibacillus riograndensis]|nr:hypothetical protein AMQ83_26215 [Paenibacillus riograndensis]
MMNRTANIVLSFVLVALTVLSYMTGSSVIRKYDGQLFSHSSVPLEMSGLFLVLLIGIGITLGFLIHGSNKISEIIILWPGVHFIVLVSSLVIGGTIWEYAMAPAFYSLIIMPINLIGEGISVGFLITRFFARENSRSKIFAMIFINLLIIWLVLQEMSKESLSELFM